MVSNRTIFEIPLTQVANSNIAGKTEVSLEFTPQAVVAGAGKKRPPATDELMEMRLFVPGSRTKGSDEESNAEEDETSAAQAFHDMIKEKAEIGQVTGEGIVTFSDILVQTPRWVLCHPSLSKLGMLIINLPQRTLRYRYVPFVPPPTRQDLRL